MKNDIKLSVVLATRNEEKNIERCIKSVKNIADEVIVVDEQSIDSTREIARGLGAKVYIEPHHEIFHITKQKALEKANGEWILQLDADEVVTDRLAKEIHLVVLSGIIKKVNNKLFLRHQRLIEQRDGKIGEDTGEVVGFFIPRKNIFLGKPLTHAGVYPDGVIRLVKKGKAFFPCKSVHEQISLKGEVSWLEGDLLHYDSPTFERYLSRFNRYTTLIAEDMKNFKLSISFLSFLNFLVFKPLFTFILLYFRHQGFRDGYQGFVWSFFSSLRFPVAFFKYWQSKE
jgi:glycosyltransferase involved in cell wall biosynthesis